MDGGGAQGTLSLTAKLSSRLIHGKRESLLHFCIHWSLRQTPITSPNNMSTQMPLVNVSGSPNQTKSNDYGKGPGVEETELIVGEERQKTVLGKSDHSALSTLMKQSKTN